MVLTCHVPAKMVLTLRLFRFAAIVGRLVLSAADSSRTSSQGLEISHFICCFFRTLSVVFLKPTLEDRSVFHPRNKPFAFLLNGNAGAASPDACTFVQPSCVFSAGRKLSTMVTPCTAASPLPLRVLEKLRKVHGAYSLSTRTTHVH